MNISILGAGNMGTALGSVIESRGHLVTFWTIEKDVFSSLQERGENTKYLPGVRFKNARVTMDIRTALSGAEIVIFSVPSHVLRSVAQSAKGLVPENAIIIDVAKGIEEKTGKRMSEILEEYFDNQIVAVGGPSIANEIGKGIPTFVVYASANIGIAKKIKELFETSSYHISVSNDVTGVELCGSFKNVVAIAAGICDGLGYGTNTKAGIITNGLNELTKIASALGAKKETIFGLAGTGDTIVTCMSPHSRNRTFGEKIGSGKSVKDALESMSQVVEGVKAARAAHLIIKENHLNCPLFEKIYKIIYKNDDINIFSMS